MRLHGAFSTQPGYQLDWNVRMRVVETLDGTLEQRSQSAVLLPARSRKGHGVDDGFRTRDLRIHNPAL